MADPITIVGCIAAAGQILAGIASTVTKLKNLREKYKDANTSITGMMQRLTTIKSAVGCIKDSIENESIVAPDGQLKKDLEIAIEGCQEAMLSLSTDVSHFAVSGNTRNFSFTERTRYILLEKTMRDHESGLTCHVMALQILVNAVQSRTEAERHSVLTKGEIEHVFQQVEDDTISLRESRGRSISGSVATMSIRGTAISAHDIEMMSMISGPGPPVRNAQAQRQQDLGSTETLRVDVVNSAQDLLSPAERVASFLAGPDSQRGPISERSKTVTLDDEGYETKSATETTSSHLSPGWTPIGERRRASPTDTDTLPDGSEIYRPRSGGPRPARTEPLEMSQTRLEEKQARLLKKPSTWFPFHRKRASGDARTPSPSNESTQSNPRTRHISRSSSIDFSSEDGLSAPPLVRAAQAGSLVEVEQLLDRGADLEAKHQRTGRNALAVAAHCGNSRTVDILLQSGAEPNCKDALGSTPLHLAASRDHVEVMKLLVKGGARIEEEDRSGRTSLWLAASNSQLRAAKFLLSIKAKVNRRAKDETPVLHAAVKKGDIDMIQLLIEYGAHVDAKDGESLAPLHHACEGGFASVVEVLIHARADIEAVGRNQMTPILEAAAAGQTQIIEILIKRKANVKKKGEHSMTALHWASFKGHVDTVDSLIASKKLSLDANTVHGQTPLHLAISSGRYDVVELLLRKRADVETACFDGFSPLHYACSTKNRKIVQLLINSGANVETINKIDGSRPIHIAATHNDIDTVKVLLRHRAELDVRDREDGRPLWIACFHGHLEVAETLLDAGSVMRAKFVDDGKLREDSPLCIAARQGHLDICSMLIARGASVREKDENEWNPLRYSAFHGHPDIVELLLLNGAELGVASGGWGFELNAERIGFSNEAPIPQDRKDRILALLVEAEQQEAQYRVENDHAIPQRSGTLNRSRPFELDQDPVSVEQAQSRKDITATLEVPNSKFAQGIYRSKTKLAPPPREPKAENAQASVPFAKPQEYPVPSAYAPSSDSTYGDLYEPNRYQSYIPTPTPPSLDSVSHSSYTLSPAPPTFGTRQYPDYPSYGKPSNDYDISSLRTSSTAPSAYGGYGDNQDGGNLGVQRSSTQMTQSRPPSTVSRSMSGGMRYRNSPGYYPMASTSLGQIQENTSVETLPGQMTFSEGSYKLPSSGPIYEMGPSDAKPRPQPSAPSNAEPNWTSASSQRTQDAQIGSYRMPFARLYDDSEGIPSGTATPSSINSTAPSVAQASALATSSLGDTERQLRAETPPAPQDLRENVPSNPNIDSAADASEEARPRAPRRPRAPNDRRRFSWEESEGETDDERPTGRPSAGPASPSTLSEQQRAHLSQPSLHMDSEPAGQPVTIDEQSLRQDPVRENPPAANKRLSVAVLEQMILENAESVD